MGSDFIESGLARGRLPEGSRSIPTPRNIYFKLLLDPVTPIGFLDALGFAQLRKFAVELRSGLLSLGLGAPRLLWLLGFEDDGSVEPPRTVARQPPCLLQEASVSLCVYPCVGLGVQGLSLT